MKEVKPVPISAKEKDIRKIHNQIVKVNDALMGIEISENNANKTFLISNLKRLIEDAKSVIKHMED